MQTIPCGKPGCDGELEPGDNYCPQCCWERPPDVSEALPEVPDGEARIDEGASELERGTTQTGSLEDTPDPVRIRTEEPKSIRLAKPEPGIPEREALFGDQSKDSDCEHFRLEYNEARIFMEKSRSSFNFRLMAMNEDARRASSVRVVLELGDGRKLEKKLKHGFKRVDSHELNLDYSPETPGVGISAELELEYRIEHRRYRYGSNFLWNCMASNTPHKQMEQVVLNIQADANYAADQHIRVMENLGRADPETLGMEIEKLNREPIWNALQLWGVQDGEFSGVFHLPPPPVPGGLDVRTLHFPGNVRLHLLHGPSLALGRTRETSDLLFRVFLPDLQVDRGSTIQISSTHLRFQMLEDRLMLLDGSGFGRRSSNGTFLDGRAVPVEGIELRPKSTCLLGLGTDAPTSPRTLRVRTAKALPGKERRPAWTFIRRQDGMSSLEMYVILDGVCDLRELMSDFPEFRIKRASNGFLPENRNAPLEIGENIQAGGCDISVTAYAPAGFTRK